MGVARLCDTTTGSLMPTTTVSAAYVRARWAYSELLSGRPYRGIGVQQLKRKAMGHLPFDDLRGEERDQLEQAWYRVRRVPTFINAFAGITTFELVQWSKEQLGSVHVIKFFAQEVGNHSVPVSFKQWIGMDPSDSVEPGHARHAASGAVPTTGGEPVTVGQLSGLLTLICACKLARAFRRTRCRLLAGHAGMARDGEPVLDGKEEGSG